MNTSIDIDRPEQPTLPWRQWLSWKWDNFKALPVKLAFLVIKRAMKKDPMWAYSWHCNIAMPILDGSKGKVDSKLANEIAESLMAHLFEVKNSDLYPHIR